MQLLILGSPASGFICVVSKETEEVDAQEVTRSLCLLPELQATITSMVTEYPIENILLYGSDKYLTQVANDCKNWFPQISVTLM